MNFSLSLYSLSQIEADFSKDERTLDSIAERLCVSRQLIGKIQKIALLKMLRGMRKLDPEYTMRDVLLGLAALAVESGEEQPPVTDDDIKNFRVV